MVGGCETFFLSRTKTHTLDQLLAATGLKVTVVSCFSNRRGKEPLTQTAGQRRMNTR